MGKIQYMFERTNQLCGVVSISELEIADWNPGQVLRIRTPGIQKREYRLHSGAIDCRRVEQVLYPLMNQKSLVRSEDENKVQPVEGRKSNRLQDL